LPFGRRDRRGGVGPRRLTDVTRLFPDFGAAVGSGVVDERQVLELGRYRDSDAFSDLEWRVLEYADRLTATPPRFLMLDAALS
jgi:hypothetical protein